MLFDLDGVLVDSRASVERTWRRWSARHGLDAAAILEVAHGRRTSETIREVVPHLDVTGEVAWLDAAELEDVDGIVAIPGAAELLAILPEGSWAIVTSCGRGLAQLRLECAGLPVPPALVTSEDVTRGKPEPDGYITAAGKLDVSPFDSIVIEDAPPGIAAGIAAGAKVVGVTTTYPAERLGGATAIVPDLRAVSANLDDGVLKGLTIH